KVWVSTEQVRRSRSPQAQARLHICKQSSSRVGQTSRATHFGEDGRERFPSATTLVSASESTGSRNVRFVRLIFCVCEQCLKVSGVFRRALCDFQTISG